ncbi:hypothetical protein Ancab_002543 [Ancistrocladus abbreviatus]
MERGQDISNKSPRNISEAGRFIAHAERETFRLCVKKGKVVRDLEREAARIPKEEARHERGTGSSPTRVGSGLPNGTVDLLGATGPDSLYKPKAKNGPEAQHLDSMNIVIGRLRKKRNSVDYEGEAVRNLQQPKRAGWNISSTLRGSMAVDNHEDSGRRSTSEQSAE